jgi:hypothetical protein
MAAFSHMLPNSSFINHQTSSVSQWCIKNAVRSRFCIICFTVYTLTVADYLMELVQRSNLGLQLGLVQTAYANGSSTNYISKTLVRYLLYRMLRKEKPGKIKL